jgi:hypothetical protein
MSKLNKDRISKHDIRRAINNIVISMHNINNRIINIENIVSLYVEYNKHDKKFEKYLEKKFKDKEGEHKQSEHK